MFENTKTITIIKANGDLLNVEIFEHHGVVCLILGEKRMDLDVESALDLADAILQVGNSIDSHLGENW